MSVSIASPQGGDTVNGLTLAVIVNYSTLITFSLPTPPSTDPPPPPPIPPVPPVPPVPPIPPPPPPPTTYQLVCNVTGQAQQTMPVMGGEGNMTFTFALTATGEYTVSVKLQQVTSTGTTVIATDDQTPIHVTNNGGGGVIVVLPTVPPPPPPPPPPIPPPPPVMGGTEALKAGATAAVKKSVAAAAETTTCPTPFVLTGTYPSSASDPTTGMVVAIYHYHLGEEKIDYVSVPLLVGSTLASGGSGSIVVGNTFSTVFPADARAPGHFFRLYLTGVMGKIIYKTSGAVPPA